MSGFFDTNFFIIDSENLSSISTKFYGYYLNENGLFCENNFDLNNSHLTGRGCYVFIHKKEDTITVSQDFMGSYGLYLFRHDDYFALSNSFNFLLDHIKQKYPISFNRDYANHFLLMNLVSLSYSDIRKMIIPGPIAAAYAIFIVVFLMKSVVNASKAVCFGISFPFALSMLPLVIYKLLRGRHDFTVYLYLSGLLTAAAWAFCSDTVLDAMTVGFTISTIAGILLLWNVGKEDGRNLLHPVLTGLTFAILLILFICFRFFGFYRDAPFRQLNTQITKGPAAGLFTTVEHAEEYNSIYDSIMEIYLKYPEEKVMFSKILPWGYLCTSWEIGAPTTWNNNISNYWMEAYFSSHPDKIPTFVFVVQPSVAGYESVNFNNHKVNHTYNQNAMEGWFYENYISKSEIIKETDYLTVYRLKK